MSTVGKAIIGALIGIALGAGVIYAMTELVQIYVQAVQ